MEKQERKAICVRVKRDSFHKSNAAELIRRLASIVSTQKNIDIKEIQFFEQDGNNVIENKVTIRFLGV